MDEKFWLPGRDGELATSANIWRKGIIFTRRARTPTQPGAKQRYCVTVAFKRGISIAHRFAGFHDLYKRVSFVANGRIAELRLHDTSRLPASMILCHGWRLLGGTGHIATAFITREIQSDGELGSSLAGLQPPTEDDLRSPSGASIEQLMQLGPQRSDEVYNEFDFTDASTSISDPITVSYAETVPVAARVDFEPFVERAESFALWYYNLLQSFGEVNSTFRIMGREWFLADSRLVTIHICFKV